MKDSLKNSLTNRNRDNPFRNQRENIYNFKINKKVNRSIEKKRNSNVQMSFKIEKHNEKKITQKPLFSVFINAVVSILSCLFWITISYLMLFRRV